MWNEAGQRVFPRKCTGHSKHPLPTTREDSTHGHHQMVNTEIRLIIFNAAKDGEALYSQQKQDQELTVAEIMRLPLMQFDWCLHKKGHLDTKMEKIYRVSKNKTGS